MKQLAITVLALCLFICAQGQSIQFINSNPSKTSFDNLWMLKIQSQGIKGSETQLKLELRKNGQLIYSALTNPVFINNEVQVVNTRRAGLNTEAFHDNLVESFVTAANALPTGTYAACAFLHSSGKPVSACIEFTVLEQAQLRLLSIPNGDQVEETDQPIFTWVFLASTIKNTDVTYHFSLYEILDGQDKHDAVLRNVPLLNKDELRLTSLQYPVDAQSLRVGAQYAWVVKARLGNATIATSEVWDFAVEEPDRKTETVVSAPYLDIDKYAPGEVLNISGELFNLRFDYSDNLNQTMAFTIIDDKGHQLRSTIEPHQTTYGANYVSLDLGTVRRLKDGNTYTLLITYGDHEKRIDFTYIKT